MNERAGCEDNLCRRQDVLERRAVGEGLQQGCIGSVASGIRQLTGPAGPVHAAPTGTTANPRATARLCAGRKTHRPPKL